MARLNGLPGEVVIQHLLAQWTHNSLSGVSGPMHSLVSEPYGFQPDRG